MRVKSQGPFCSYSSSNTPLFMKERVDSCFVCSPQFNQATRLLQLSLAPRTVLALDQTPDDRPFARHPHRSDQRIIRIACRKRLVMTPTDHPLSTHETCAGYLVHPLRKGISRDLVVPFCLQERGGKGRIREHSCLSYFSALLSLHKGETLC